MEYLTYLPPMEMHVALQDMEQTFYQRGWKSFVDYHGCKIEVIKGLFESADVYLVRRPDGLIDVWSYGKMTRGGTALLILMLLFFFLIISIILFFVFYSSGKNFPRNEILPLLYWRYWQDHGAPQHQSIQ